MNSLTRARIFVKGSLIFPSAAHPFREEQFLKDIPDDLKVDQERIQNLARWRVTEQDKYIFIAFSGPDGQTRLKSILRAILTLSQYTTWEAIMSFGGFMPYPGTEAIAERMGRSQRTVQENLKGLRDLGLLREIRGQAPPKKDGTPVAHHVDYKDFSAIYHFAHEYYEWTCTSLYQRYGPTNADCKRLKERHNIYEAMHNDSQLLTQFQTHEELYQDILLAEYIYRKVLRFENYARHLQHIKDIAQEQIEQFCREIAGDADPQEDLDEDAPYIVNNNNNIVTMDDSNHPSPAFNFFNDNNGSNDNSLHSLKNDCSVDNIQIRTISTSETSNDLIKLSASLSKDLADNSVQQQKEEIAVVELIASKTSGTTNLQTLPLQPVTPTFKETGPKSAKQVKNQIIDEKSVYSKNGKAYQSREELKAAQDRYKESQALLARCENIAHVVRYICRDLNDKSPKTTPTTVCKIYEESGLSEEEFLQIIHYAREHVRKLYDEQITSKDEQGKTKRVPLFIKEIRKAVKEGVDVLRARDRASAEARLTGPEREKRDYELAHPSKPFWEEPGSDAFCEEDEEARCEILRNEYKKLFPGRMEAQDDPVSAKETNDQETSSAGITMDQDAAYRATFPAGKRVDQEDAESSSDAFSQNQDRLPDQPFFASDSYDTEKERNEGVRLRSRSNPLGLSMAEIWPMADEIWHHAMKQALLNLYQATGLLVIYHEQACRCGGHLATITSGSRRRCLSCENPPKWNRSALDGLQAYLEAQVPEPEECLQQVLDRLGLAQEDVPDYEAYLDALSASEMALPTMHDARCSAHFPDMESEPCSVPLACKEAAEGPKAGCDAKVIAEKRKYMYNSSKLPE